MKDKINLLEEFYKDFLETTFAGCTELNLSNLLINIY